MDIKDKQFLLDYLSVVDNLLERKIILVAAGGTAMTLLNIKNSTKDVDFTGPSKDIIEFEKAESLLPPTGLDIQCWPDGRVFSQELPDDYIRKSIDIDTHDIKNIILKALQPLDIIVTKVGRYNDRDVEDIRDCIKVHNIEKESIISRGKEILKTYPGNEDAYKFRLRKCINDNYEL